MLVVFSIVFLFLWLLLLSIYKMFFVDFYIESNQYNMQKKGKEFASNYNSQNAIELINKLRRDTGGQVILYNAHWKQQYVENELRRGLALEHAHLNVIKSMLQNDERESYFELDQRDGQQRLVYALMVNDSEMIVIIKPMGLVEEANKMFYAFLTRSSVAVYIIGFLLIYIISGIFSRPVVKMKNITQKMANLDFNEKLQVKSNDEIGELMSSINLMAKELSNAINTLNITNNRLEIELSKERSLEKMRRRFVSDVSHELKNPISIILGYAEGLVQKIPKTEEVKDEYYNIIVDETTRMNQLVKDLLELSSYESGAFSIDRTNFEINELIDDAIERFSYIMNEKTVKVEYNPSKRYELNADRLRIGQVIMNILSNAFKYVDDGGKIKIELSEQDNKCKMLVANTGRLIDEKELDLIWNSFYRIRSEKNGNGLGLAIVKSIIELHKGSYRAYTKGGFNCFEIII